MDPDDFAPQTMVAALKLAELSQSIRGLFEGYVPSAEVDDKIRGSFKEATELFQGLIDLLSEPPPADPGNWKAEGF